MSVVYRQTIDDALAARLRERYGALDWQEITRLALRNLAYGSEAEQLLRDEIARLHATLRQQQPASNPPASIDERLSF